MTQIKISEDEYSKKLLFSSNYANISNAENDELIINEFMAVKEPKVGWYVTDFFFKDKKELSQNIYENKDFKENIKNDKSSVSKNFEFNETITTELLGNKSTDIFKIALFNIAFPVYFNQKKIIIVMSIKKLPFQIDFEFTKNGNDIKTTPRIQTKYFEDQLYEQVLEILKRKQADFKDFFDISIYEMSHDGMTYTQFLRFIYNDTSKENQKANHPKLIEKDKLSGLFFLQDTLTCVLNSQQEIEIINNNPNTSFSFNISPIKNLGSYNNPTFFANTNKDESDARKLYWKSCILNDSVIPNDKKKKDNFDQKIKNVNARGNYYDIDFKTSDVKTFLFTYHSPGFHVINFRPDELYPNPSNVTIKSGDKKIISLQNVYKKLFVNKILQLNIEQL
jgi:hypothetical protein